MSTIADIANSEAGSSVRTKLNLVIAQVNNLINKLFVPVSTPVALTDGASVTVDCLSTDNKLFTLSASNTTFTMALANLADGHTCQVQVAPQSTATFTATFTHTGLTCKVAGAAGAAWAFDATSGNFYRVFATRIGSNVYVSPDSRPY